MLAVSGSPIDRLIPQQTVAEGAESQGGRISVSLWVAELAWFCGLNGETIPDRLCEVRRRPVEPTPAPPKRSQWQV